jgi:hypothetical protein
MIISGKYLKACGAFGLLPFFFLLPFRLYVLFGLFRFFLSLFAFSLLAHVGLGASVLRDLARRAIVSDLKNEIEPENVENLQNVQQRVEKVVGWKAADDLGSLHCRCIQNSS